jgi:hypothetical protein
MAGYAGNVEAAAESFRSLAAKARLPAVFASVIVAAFLSGHEPNIGEDVANFSDGCKAASSGALIQSGPVSTERVAYIRNKA